MLATNSLQAQDSNPLFEATIVGDEAVVRSGPGETHYGTDRLAPGTTVQVYRKDPGGWMAIRPPEGSFSLVQMNELEIVQDDLAKITKTETVAWVGTRLNSVTKPMWQVRLRKGEVVRILGKVDRKKFKLTEEEPDWMQIEPPAGEFRWIAAKHLRRLERQPRESENRSSFQDSHGLGDSESEHFDWDSGFESDMPNLDVKSGSSIDSASLKPFEQWDSQPADRDFSQNAARKTNSNSNKGASDSNWSLEVEDNDYAGWKPAKQPISKFVQQRSQFVAGNQAGSANGGSSLSTQFSSSSGSLEQDSFNQPTNKQNDPSTRSNIFDATDSVPSASRLAEAYQEPSRLLTPTFNQVQSTVGKSMQRPTMNLPAGHPILDLELALSNEMAGRTPQQWNLESLANQARQLRAQSNRPDETELLDYILRKIENCRQIQAGYQGTNDGRMDLEASRTGNRLAGNSPNSNQSYQNNNRSYAGTGSSSTNNLLMNYDASGYLAELVRSNGTAPSTFVLKDNQGRITHHVAAPPGLNLRRYLNQRVGIIGNRGYNQQLRLEHVTAERITTVR